MLTTPYFTQFMNYFVNPLPLLIKTFFSCLDLKSICWGRAIYYYKSMMYINVNLIEVKCKYNKYVSIFTLCLEVGFKSGRIGHHGNLSSSLPASKPIASFFQIKKTNLLIIILSDQIQINLAYILQVSNQFWIRNHQIIVNKFVIVSGPNYPVFDRERLFRYWMKLPDPNFSLFLIELVFILSFFYWA